MCGLGREDHIIGSLATSNTSLKQGVVSAAVGRGEGWIVKLFDAVKSNVDSTLLEWTFRPAGCWFHLRGPLGVNQSDHVF